jgi:anaerobic selenocysteine-containing dehydrogenase
VNHRMWPGASGMEKALKKLQFFVDVDLFMTDTARFADIILPACSSLERGELTIQGSRFASWTEPAIPPVGESRPDVDIIVDLSAKLGLDDPLLSQGHEACLEWMFAPSRISIGDIKKHPGGSFLSDRSETPYEKYRETGFPTPSGKMEFTSLVLKAAGFDSLPTFREPELSPVSTPEVAARFPLILTTGARLPMHMHSRTYRIPWMRQLRPDPMADINPRDASDRGLAQGEWVSLGTPWGAISVKANVTELAPSGIVNVYHGFPGADANDLIDPDYRDPISGYPGYKSLLCDVKKLQNEGGK